MQEPERTAGADDPPDSVAFVRFRVGGFPLAVEAGHVARVAPVPERTRLPGAPDPVVGLGYVAGEPTVLLALHERLDVAAEGGDRRVVVLRTGDEPVGVLADGTSGLQTAPAGAVAPVDEATGVFLDDAATDPLFRAVVSFEDGQAYALAPEAVAALAAAPSHGEDA